MADPVTPAVPAAKPATPAPAADITTKTLSTEKSPGQTDADMVEVTPLKPYSSSSVGSCEDKRVLDGKPYTVTRSRAAALRANGLVEYTNAADKQREEDDAVAAAGNAVRKKYEVKK